VLKWRQTGYLTDCSVSTEKDPGFDCYDGKNFESRPLWSRRGGMQACKYLVTEGANVFRIGSHEKKAYYRDGENLRIHGYNN
jgi:hypothetical protein